MRSLVTFFRSSIGNKILMALSGLFLIGFIVAHLLGNLEIFSGQEAVNSYATFLRSIPKLLWGLRIATILAFALHIMTSVKLTLENRAARPIAYTRKKSVTASIASRTMLWGGFLVLAFVIYHLAHFTWNLTNPEFAELIDDKGRHDVYSMMVLGFQNVYNSFFYITAQIALAFHLSHGFASAAQTLSITSAVGLKLFRQGGLIFSLLIAALYISIPASVWFGFVTLP